MRANETYSTAKRQLSDRNIAVLMTVQSPYKWWSSISSLPPLVSVCGVLMCESVGIRLICCRII